MVMFCSLPVPLSLAVTFRIPLASMLKVTSICGTPRGAGGMPSRMKRPSDLVAFDHFALTLADVDFYLRLVVGSGTRRLRICWLE